jgi:predicted RNA-binding Zn ribbon-like protein
MTRDIDPRPLPGEPLALDLLNTVFVHSGATVDTFEQPRGLERWLAANDLPSSGGDVERESLIETRAAIRGVAEGGDPDARRRFDAVLDHGRIRLSMDKSGAITRHLDVDDAWRVAVMAATNLVELLETSPERIRRCDHPNCVLWFFDTTRNGARRWCSMAGCGNRAKAQRHYERSKTR